MMALDQLLAGWAAAPPWPVQALTLDSREVDAGTAFVALPGARTHGLAHADEAAARGASAVLFEPPAPQDIVLPPIAVPVPELRARLGAIADRFHGSPSQALRVVGVTGTNGKTSTVQLLVQALTRRGRVAGSIGTLGAGLHGQLEAGDRTTPDVVRVHALLRRLRDAGAGHVAMEVSSHALDQGRVDAVAFRVAVFTNLTRDHLDYHGTMQRYGEAKARLFRWPTLNAVVINLDDPFGLQLWQSTPRPPLAFALSSRASAGANLRADDVALGAEGLGFTLSFEGKQASIASGLIGRFNVDNLLAVAGSLLALGEPFEALPDTLAALTPVDGRMQRMGGGAQAPLVVVDYAHTPDALQQALQSLRGHTRARLHCVFGCGGERDAGKRPQMAAIAQAHADAVIVTDDNPRSEDGDRIVADILAGFARRDTVRVERDRARAIRLAVSGAAPGDTVLIAGKGHEPYQEIDGQRHAFDDRQVARAALQERT